MGPADRLERSQWDFFWVPDDASVHDRPELLHVSCPRDVRYLNAVTRTDPTYGDLDGLVAEVSRAHVAVRSRWVVPSRIAHDRLHRALNRGGYEATNEHDGRAIEARAFVPRPRPECRVVRVTSIEQLRDLVSVGKAAFGHDRAPSGEELRADLRQCMDPGGRVHRFVAYANGRPVSAGGLTVFDSLGFGFLWAGCTIPEAEGRGYYSAVVGERIAWAAARGLHWIGLYARTTTSSLIVAAQGFGRFGTMTYWERSPHGGPSPPLPATPPDR
ncbi:MAG: GNAT family N-acetyltransferase [Myxococcota bacterium]